MIQFKNFGGSVTSLDLKSSIHSRRSAFFILKEMMQQGSQHLEEPTTAHQWLAYIS
jgi:hypothetical protein